MVVPGRLPVIVRMDIYESWGDKRTGRIDLSLAGTADLANLGDGLAIDSDIGSTGRAAASVNDVSASDYQIVRCHGGTPNGPILLVTETRG